MSDIKRKTVFQYIVVLLLLIVVVPLKSQELRGGLTIPIVDREKLSLEVELETRFVFNERLMNDANMGTAKLGYKIFNNLELGTTYRRTVDFRNINNEETTEPGFLEDDSRITFDMVHKTRQFDDFSVKSKLRYQISDFGSEKEKDYLRYKMLIDYKFSRGFRPYYGGEFVFKLNNGKMKSIRLHLGNESKIFNSRIEQFFIIENVIKENTPVNLNYILGFNIKI